jgi:glycosyltransferase involved in cell wall biosynthesis
MKKILFILHYPPPVHGATMVGQFIRESEEINGAFDCRYINLGTSRSVDEIGKGGLIKWLRYFKILWLAFRNLINFKPNLVYLTLTASGAGFYKDAIVALLVKAFGKKVVYHFHNKGISLRQDKWLDNLLYRLVFKRAEVILLSKHLYYDIQKYVPKERVHYCANGIPENNTIVPKANNQKGKVQLLFLSNLIAAKGVYILLQACQRMQAKQLPFHCSYVGGEGDITAKQFQEKVRELGIEDCVHHAGKKYGREKQEAYAQADVFVLPTYYPNECFPLVLLEAMQSSLPIVSTYEGGIPAIVEDGKTGLLIKQLDANTLAGNLGTLIKDVDLRLQMGKNGRKNYEEQYTLEYFEKNMYKILNII